ncbi:hypothetical protein GCM10010415_31860 [Streptomyces atrovirens]
MRGGGGGNRCVGQLRRKEYGAGARERNRVGRRALVWVTAVAGWTPEPPPRP